MNQQKSQDTDSITIKSSGLEQPKPQVQSTEDEKIAHELEQLSNAYTEGQVVKNKINHSPWYNFGVIALSITAAVCLGIIIGYLLYVFC